MRKFLSDILVKASLGVEQNAYVLGTVGIGTSSPAYKLDVIGNTRVYGSYLVVDQTAGYNTSILLNQSGIIQWYMTNQATTGKLVFGNGNGDLVWIGTTGNVGIGTSSPSEKLSVNGTFSSNAIWTTSSSITLWGPYSTAYGGLTWDTGQATVYATSGNKLYLASNGASPDMTIDTNGNVGIGTTSPSVKLHLLGTTETSVRVSDSGGAYMELYQQSTDSYILATNSLRFYSGGSERVTLSSGGNVGIGTSSPGEKLDVNGGGRFLSSVTTYAGSGSYYGRISTEYNYPYIETFIDSIAGVSWDGRLVFRTNSNAGAAVTAMVIDPFGKIGMGTSTPGAKLDVRGRTNIWGAGTTSATLGLSVLDNPGSNYNFYVEDNGGAYLRGNVRIGNSTDNGYKFDVSGTGRFTSNLDVDSYILTRSKLQISNGRLFELIGTSTALNIYDASAGSSRIYITDAGNVGIGTTSPVSTLDVNGTVTISGPSAVKWKYSDNYAYFGIGYISGADYGFYNYNYGRTDLYIQQSSGNIGIGTSNTPFLLTVNGYLAATRFIAYNSGAPSYIGNRIDYGTFGSSYGWKIYTDGADMASFFNDRILFNNNVGIGTISPASKLHIAGGDIWVNTVPTTQGIQFGYSGPSHGSYRAAVMGGPEAYGGSDSGMLTFHTQNGYVVSSTPPERMRITSVGNVGIGFAGPEYKLDVNGNTRSNQYIFPFVAFNPSAGARTTTDPMSIKMWQNYFNGTGLGSDYGTVLEYYSRDGHVDSQVYFDASGGSWYRTAAYAASFGAWQKYMTSLDISGTTNYVSKFTSANSLGNSQIFDNGTNVGIGTTSPEAKLDIYSAFAGNNKLFYVRNGAGSVNTQVYDTAVIQSSDVTTLRMVERNVGDTDQLMTFTIGDGYGRISTTAQPLQFFVNGSASGLGYQGLSGTLAMTIATSGNVGIGTASPSSRLEIQNSSYDGLTLSRTAQSAGSYIQSKSYDTSNVLRVSNTIVFGASAGASRSDGFIALSTANADVLTERMRINSLGNVGIGTTTPTAPLDTNGVRLGRNWAITNRADIRLDSNGPDYPADILFGHTAAANQTGWDGVYWSLSSRASSLSNAFTIWRGSGNPGGSGEEVLFTILPNGNVGIGTTTPGQRLSVAGNIESTYGHGKIGFNVADAYGDYPHYGLGKSNGAYPVNLAGYYGLTFGTNGVQRVAIDGSGNVGIGTTSPANKLVAVSDASPTSENSYAIAAASASDPAYKTIIGYSYANDVGLIAAVMTGIGWRNISMPQGNFGIGTLSPSQKLHVLGNAVVTGFVNAGTGTDNAQIGPGYLGFYNAGSSPKYIKLSDDASTIDAIGFSKSGSSSTTWFPSGNVGIGTASPSKKLVVAGASSELQLYSDSDISTIDSRSLGNTSNKWLSINPSGGNVGIGTDSPGNKLTVNGNTRIVTPTLGGLFAYDAPSGGSFIWALTRYTDTNANDLNVNALSGFGVRTGVSGLTTSGHQFYVTSGGNVGIGTTSPAKKVTIAASSQTWDGAPQVAFYDTVSGQTDSRNWTIGAISTNYGNFTIANSTAAGGDPTNSRFTINKDGNVGIGTTSPAHKLHVVGNSAISNNNSLFLLDTAGASGFQITNTSSNIALLFQQNNNILKYRAGFSSNSNNAHVFTVGADTEVVRFTNDGNVGIGTNAPSTTLEVFSTDSTGTRTNPHNILTLIAENGNVPYGGFGGGIVFKNRAYTSGIVNSSRIRSVINNNSVDNFGGSIAFDVTSTVGGSYAEAMLINYNSNVGIGTNSPGGRLHIYEAGLSAYKTYTTTGAGVIINSYQSQGSPYTKTTDIVASSDGTVPSEMRFFTRTSGSASIAERLRIDSSGNVGINTTTPGSYKLYVNGGQYGTMLRGGDLGTGSDVVRMIKSDNSVAMLVRGDGNVGIGTTSPAYKLDVSGTGRFTSNLYINNTNGTGIVNAYSSGEVGTYIAKASSATANFTTTGVSYPRGLGFGAIIGQGNTTDIPVNNASWNGGYGGNIGFWSDVHYGVEGGTNSIGFNAVIKGSGNSNSYGFFSDLSGATDGVRYGIYTKGEQQNYFSGNVGIGTTSPQGPLEIYKANTGGLGGHIILNNNGFAVGNETAILFNDSGVGSVGYVRAAISSTTENSPYAGDIKFKTGIGTYASLSTKMIIKGDGNVGIGTTNPQYKLHVAGNGAFTGVAVTNPDTSGTFNRSSIDVSSNQITLGFTAWGQGSVRAGTAWVQTVNNWPLVLGVNDAEVMRLATSGNVGIGTSSPGYKLHVVGEIYNNYRVQINDGTANLIIGHWDGVNARIENSGGRPLLITSYSQPINMSISGSGPAFSLKADSNAYFTGSLGIGTTSPVTGLDVRTSPYSNTTARFGTSRPVYIINDDPIIGFNQYYNSGWKAGTTGYSGNVGVSSAGEMYFNVSTSSVVTDNLVTQREVMRILNNGNVGIGTASPSYKLHVEGNVSGISIYASHDIAAFSDITVKKEVRRIENAIEKVKELNGYTYVRTDDETGTRRAGVIAQEVQKVLPEVVSANPDGTLNVAYSNMIALLIEGMKEQQATIEKLQSEINELKK